MTEPLWPKNDQTDELLARAKGGAQEAVNQLLDRHRKALHRMIEMRLDQRVTRRVDVSDVLQDVMIEANRRLQNYLNAPPMAFHLWIRQIARDRIIDAHRRHAVSAKRSVEREMSLNANARVDQSSVQLAGLLRDGELTPAAAATQREIAAQLEAAIHQLRDQDKEIILMRHYEQLSNLEVAQSLGMTEPATSMRYLRALRRLKDLLKDQNSELASDEDE
jgi:RNA polymerase sigma-70 factor, ECF subfamily